MKIKTVKTKKDLRLLCEYLEEVSKRKNPFWRAFAFDTETYAPGGKKTFKKEGLVIDRGRVMFISIARKNRAWGIPLSSFDPAYLDTQYVMKKLEPFFADRRLTKVMHHANYDINMVMNHGVKFDLRSIYCTMIAGHCWDERIPNALKERAVLIGMRLRKTSSVDMKNIDEIVPYACNDAISTWKLYDAYERGYKARTVDGVRNMLLKGTRRKFFEMEMESLAGVIRMERRGIRLNPKGIKRIDRLLADKMDKCAAKVYQKNGKEFNLNSKIQLGKFLFGKLGLEPVEKTPTGRPKVDKVCLAYLLDEHPLVKQIVNYNAYLSLRRFTGPDTGLFLYCDDNNRIHTTYSQVGARTARSSSSNPNLQQIPSKTDILHIRECFVPKPGNKLIVADMEQLELRLMAIFSLDKMMLRCFRKGISIHIQTGVETGLLPKGITKDEIKAELKYDRSYMIAKNCNFALQYEGMWFTLQRQLILEGVFIEKEEAIDIIDKYWNIYYGVPIYREQLYESCRERGFIKNICGRPFRIRNISSEVFRERKAAERQCINTQIQSSAADWLKHAMILCDASKELKSMKCRMLMQIHDELIFEVPAKYANEAAKVVQRLMETPPPNLTRKLVIPLLVSVGIGDSWATAKN